MAGGAVDTRGPTRGVDERLSCLLRVVVISPAENMALDQEFSNCSYGHEDVDIIGADDPGDTAQHGTDGGWMYPQFLAIADRGNNARLGRAITLEKVDLLAPNARR